MHVLDLPETGVGRAMFAAVNAFIVVPPRSPHSTEMRHTAVQESTRSKSSRQAMRPVSRECRLESIESPHCGQWPRLRSIPGPRSGKTSRAAHAGPDDLADRLCRRGEPALRGLRLHQLRPRRQRRANIEGAARDIGNNPRKVVARPEGLEPPTLRFEA